MQKEIKYNEGKLLIGYCENSQDISVYESRKYTEPIRVTFIPNIEMTEQRCCEYTKNNLKSIIEEIKIIINENNSFYDNFDITFYDKFTGYSLYRHNLNRDLLIVSNSTMNVDCKLKQKVLQETKILSVN